MGKFLLVFALILICKLSIRADAQKTFVLSCCDRSFSNVNYTQGSVYEDNLNLLLNDLTSKTSSLWFYNTSVGESSNKVYGYYQCRHDFNISNCDECVREAAIKIIEGCPLFGVAVQYYVECTLWYGRESIYSTYSIYPGVYSWPYINVSSSDEFELILAREMSGVINSASSSTQRYASSEAKLKSNQTLYSFGQCTPGLNVSECNRCLKVAWSSLIEVTNSSKQWGGMLYPSCQVRYNSRAPILNVQSSQSPPPTIPPDPPPPSKSPIIIIATPPPSKSLIIIIAVAVGLGAGLIVLAVGLWICSCRKKPTQESPDIPPALLSPPLTGVHGPKDHSGEDDRCELIKSDGHIPVDMESVEISGPALLISNREYSDKAERSEKIKSDKYVHEYMKPAQISGPDQIKSNREFPDKAERSEVRKSDEHIRGDIESVQIFGPALIISNPELPDETKRSEVKHDEHIRGDKEFVQYDFATLRSATTDFSDENKLGEGEFGSVYKGTLRNSDQLAIKRLSGTRGLGTKEFAIEARLLAKLQHGNLVKLLGFCSEGDEKLLVYELMSNSSLDRLLFDERKRYLLDWELRYKLITEIARGLQYLHEDSRRIFMHGGLKPATILLDKEMCPKITDFGLAKLYEGAVDLGTTARIVGTEGYMAPEYLMTGVYSDKSDVYSYGIMLLEIVSGRTNRVFQNKPQKEDLSIKAWRLWKERRSFEILDYVLFNNCPSNDVMRCIQIGMLCVQANAEERPTMSAVVLMLTGTGDLPLPLAPAMLSNQYNNMPMNCDGAQQSDHDQYSTKSVTRITDMDEDLYPPPR